ncbi:MAG: hypothetical protein ACOYMA_07150 [Bacteroidia bacterium]
MKHLIVTPNEDYDITLLLNEISKIAGVKNVELENNFAIAGNVLNESDYINIVNEADVDEYLPVKNVFDNFKKKFSE